MVTQASEEKRKEMKEIEANGPPSSSKIRFFKRLRKLLSRSGRTILGHKNKAEKFSDFTINSIHRQYTSATLKLYPCIGQSEDCSKGSIEKFDFGPEYDSCVAKQNRPNLDTLPECILLNLFPYLNTQDLCSLCRCARNVYTAGYCKKNLWRNVHHVCDGSSPCHSILQPFLNDFTSTLHLSKTTDSSSSDLVNCENACFEYNFLTSLKNLSNLKSFTLENHSVTRNTLNLRCLPQSLTELRLQRLNFLSLNETQCLAFHNVHLNLPNLREVDLSHCTWVTSQVLYSLSHCDNLKKLKLVGCTKVDYTDTTLQAATIYGFWKLEILDLRLTNVTFEDVSLFKKLTRLREILMEKPEDRYVKTPKQEAKSKKKRGHPWRGSGCSWTKSADMSPASCNMETITLSDYVSSRLETLVVRNYPEINDLVLEEIRMYFGSLKYLDITNTKCTHNTILTLLEHRPNLELQY